jgi:hypothetical protein
MSASQSIHDGQSDAMPCVCALCQSPFIINTRSRLAGGPQEAIECDAGSDTDGASIARASALREARAC